VRQTTPASSPKKLADNIAWPTPKPPATIGTPSQATPCIVSSVTPAEQMMVDWLTTEAAELTVEPPVLCDVQWIDQDSPIQKLADRL
jgi:hypothetical protein